MWHQEAINADLQNYSDRYMEIQWEWWYGKPISIPIPTFRFAIPEDGPLPDNYWNATLFDLYLDRLVSILGRVGISYESYPVEIVGKNSGEKLPVNYQVFRLLEIENALDRVKSVFRYEDHRGQRIEYLEKPVLAETFLRKRKPLVRIQGFEDITIIHVELMELLEKEGITGCNYSIL